MACLLRRQAQSRQEVRTQLENEGLRDEVAHLRHLLAVAQAGPPRAAAGAGGSGVGVPKGGGCSEAAGQLALRQGTLARVRAAQLERQVLRLEAELKVGACLWRPSFPLNFWELQQPVDAITAEMQRLGHVQSAQYGCV